MPICQAVTVSSAESPDATIEGARVIRYTYKGIKKAINAMMFFTIKSSLIQLKKNGRIRYAKD
ncbi:MAG: hypothetical protein A2497_08830 [Candidatus Firestonebacteria bacterium RifOxyC12_full_39_7]|nr:MAG: hypothetical protein A2536_09965 [Candidatus Firestonebacteria bacterium RIFOXYD2_FULL_39_29]OGF54243.1 MAG: hypothetical protein A2497_08830 [Candidatus Firestonebacteria bacterium RifOxyC12_full_39_7]